ncbi:MAG: MgtC/SapB family protein [Candidatus Eisenbacteria bacterium]
MAGLWGQLIEADGLVKLILSLFLGGVVGLERELKGRPAGLRTHVLVCIGSTIMLIAAQHAATFFAGEDDVARLVLDPNRIAAGIVTGIGFLGAGAIMRTGDFIRGLTTAATIWYVAALGIVIGNGAFALATGSTVLVLIVLEGLDVIEHRIPQVAYRIVRLKVDGARRLEIEARCRQIFAGQGIRVQDVLYRIDLTLSEAELAFHVRTRTQRWTPDLIEKISAVEGVRHMETGRA